MWCVGVCVANVVRVAGSLMGDAVVDGDIISTETNPGVVVCVGDVVRLGAATL